MNISICAVFKDEALYLKEWIEFHRLLGVTKFYLYNHNSTDDYLNILSTYIDLGIVELTDWLKVQPVQLDVYLDCIHKHSGYSEWIAFIDIDEFLFSPKYKTILEALETLPEEWGAVGVNWVCFGTSGKTEWEDSLVIERFTWRVSDVLNNHVKSIVKMWKQPIYTNLHAHTFKVSGGGTFIESGEYIGNQAGGYTHSSNVLRINHYASKSWNEYKQRLLKGDVSRGPGPRVPNDGGDFWLTKSVYDDSLLKFVSVVKDRMLKF